MDEIEIEFNDVRKGVRIRLKGSKAVVDSYLERFGYNDAIKESSQQQEPETPRSSPREDLQTLAIPDKPMDVTSISQYLVKLMYGPWGAAGRTSTDMVEVAKAHGIAISMSSLSGILHGLVNSGKLKRIRSAGETQWIYFPPASVSMANR